LKLSQKVERTLPKKNRANILRENTLLLKEDELQKKNLEV
jgi:hypothetical protein